MKTTRLTQPSAILATVLAAAAIRASADQTAPVPGNAANTGNQQRIEESYTGKVVSVDPLNRTLHTKSWGFPKNFTFGDNCVYALVGKEAGMAGDLRPGETITVHYQNVYGVRVANRIDEHSTKLEGTVKAMDPQKHTLTLQLPSEERTLRVAADCHVALRHNPAATLTDIQPGQYVAVTYDTPDNIPTARRIAQSSIEFTGRLTAIDLDEKTVTAKTVSDRKKFNLGNNCIIVTADNKNIRLGDLKPNDRLTFSYDEINGVNVVNRIEPAAAESSSPVAVGSPDWNYPVGY